MQRPSGVTVIAVLDFIGAGSCVIGALAFGAIVGLVATNGNPNSPLARFAGIGGAAGAAIFLFFAALSIAIGVGLLKLRNWARLVSIFFAVLGVVLIVVGFVLTRAHVNVFSSGMDVLFLALDGWIAWYLLSAKVKQAFTPAQG